MEFLRFPLNNCLIIEKLSHYLHYQQYILARNIVKITSVVNFRKGSVVAEFELVFTKDVEDPFKILQEAINCGHMVNVSMEISASAGQLLNLDASSNIACRAGVLVNMNFSKSLIKTRHDSMTYPYACMCKMLALLTGLHNVLLPIHCS